MIDQEKLMKLCEEMRAARDKLTEAHMAASEAQVAFSEAHGRFDAYATDGEEGLERRERDMERMKQSNQGLAQGGLTYGEAAFQRRVS